MPRVPMPRVPMPRVPMPRVPMPRKKPTSEPRFTCGFFSRKI
jgi:hypothetical protein